MDLSRSCQTATVDWKDPHTISADMPIRGIATSGMDGRSFSFGIADAVTVLAPTTAAGCRCCCDTDRQCRRYRHPAIERVPANRSDPDIDLGGRLVTVSRGPLSETGIRQALECGTARATQMMNDGKIEAALLACDGQIRIVENPKRQISETLIPYENADNSASATEDEIVIDPLLIEEQIGQILREDIGFGDLTSTIMIDEDTTGVFDVNAREDIVVAGMAVAAAIFKRCEPGCTFEPKVNDGDHITDGTTMARVSGKARGLLTAERSALNMLQHLSGIATLTSKYVKEIEGTGATLIDTRKTTPGLRALEKHAVTCGGGRNHRLALDGGVLVKDNHIAVCGGLTAAIQSAKSQVPTLTKVQVECDNLDQVKAVEAGADSLLLDNMSPNTMREAAKIVDGRITLEASGGITLETVRAKAGSGVDLISTGKITQSAPSVDIGLDDVET